MYADLFLFTFIFTRLWCSLVFVSGTEEEKPKIPCCNIMGKDTGSQRTLAAHLILLNCPPPEDDVLIQQAAAADNQDFSHHAKAVRLIEPWDGCVDKGRREGCPSHGQMLLRFASDLDSLANSRGNLPRKLLSILQPISCLHHLLPTPRSTSVTPTSKLIYQQTVFQAFNSYQTLLLYHTLRSYTLPGQNPQ